ALTVSEGVNGIVIEQPSLLTVSATTEPACVENTGSINLTVSGGNTGGYNYAWIGPTTIGNVQNPTGLAVGTYSVSVTDTRGCSRTLTNIVVPPATMGGLLSPSASEVCSGTNTGTIFLSDHYGNIVRWESSTDNFATVITDIQNAGNTSYTFNNLNTTQFYRAVVQAAGCPTEYSSISTIVVNPTPDQPEAFNNGPLCVGATLNLTTETVSGATYSWTGPNGFASTEQNPVINNVAVVNGGTYSLVVTVDDCPSPAGVTEVVVFPNPIAPEVFNNGPLCVGGTLNLTTEAVAGAIYAWTSPNGFTSSDQNPSLANVTAANAGTYSLIITVNNCPSPAGTTEVIIYPIPATPIAQNNGPICVGETLNLTTDAVAGATYLWTGPNSFTSAAQNPSISNTTAANAGTYSLTITVDNCPSLAGTTDVIINATPTPTAFNNGPLCVGEILNLTTEAVAGATYAWAGPNGFTSSDQNPSINNVTVANAGSYSLVVTLNNCPSLAGTTNVIIHPIPSTPVASNNGPICVGQTLTLTTEAVAGATYAWTGPNGFTFSDQNPSLANVTAANAGTYSLIV
ncbi:MAG: hypothetical protein M3512_06095, partial [Bacteroidota bacterium]|nr:hypothetical protein [Bacteroidota bacterium]